MGERLLITGAKGMLGQAVDDAARGGPAFGHVLALGHHELDITDKDDVEEVVSGFSPSVIINCAAYTDVDGAETARDTAFRVNALGPRVLSRSANRCGAKLIHVSSDYVFDGRSKVPYREYTERRPISAYGESKALGEQFIEEECADFLIVRTSWLFGPGGRNFVATIYGLAMKGQDLRVVDDQRGRPTYTKDLAHALLALYRSNARGIYHFSNSGECSWFELAKEIVRLQGLEVDITPVATTEFPRPAPRPTYSVLDTRKYTLVTGLAPRPWKEALKEYLSLLSEG